MIFGSNYYSSMDRGYQSSAAQADDAVGESEKPILGVKDIGKTIIDGRDQGTFVQSVGRAIREGAGRLELQPGIENEWAGAGVENYSKEMRKEIRDLAKLNNVELQSVHTPVQIGNISGRGEEGYSEAQRDQQINEVKKHIDFAADVNEGGAVVVHTGEFPRSISENFGDQFQGYAGEEKEAIAYLVDKRTGKIIQGIRKSSKFLVPEWETNDKRPKDENNYYVDDNGERVKKIEDRVPVYDTTSGNFKVKEAGWEYFEKEAKEWEKIQGRKFRPEEVLYRTQIEAQEKESIAWANHYETRYKQSKKQIDELEQAKEQFAQLKQAETEEERKRIVERMNPAILKEFIRSDDPFKDIDQAKEMTRKEMLHERDAAISYQQTAKVHEMERNNVTPIGDYAKKQSVKSLKELGIYAMEEEKAKHLKKDLYIAPEHIFPQMGYGSHPEELIELVTEARKAMAEELEVSMGPERAKQEAEKHIKATLDTQHLGMWRRHFTRKPGENDENYDKRFNEWYMDEVKKMHEKGIIGNIHIVDGFGKGHTHLVAGQGLFPVVDAVKWLKGKGYDKAMSSEAHGDLQHMLTGTWKAFGTDIYSMARPGSAIDSWTNIENSYFGRTGPPNYVVGEYKPSDDWTLWSGVPLE
jgi:hypothetical protein